MTASSSRATTPYRAVVELGSRLTRDTLLYAVGTSLTLPVGLIITGFLTRHLHIAQFGELAVLLAFASVLTIVLNMVFLQGPLLLVFLHSEDSGELSGAEAEAVARQERPVMLSTGLAVTIAVGAVAIVLVSSLADPLAALLCGHRSAAGAVRLAGVSAAAGAVWRYTTNVTRFEKRALSFAVWAAVRPLVALLVTVPLVELGFGLRAALIGTALGSLVSATGAVAVSHSSYAPRVRWGFVARAGRTGLPWVPVVLGLYFAHSADLLLLRATASNAQLGVYRIADSLSQIISYAVSAFHLAQVPLDATLMSQAAYDQFSRDRVMASYVLVYMIGAVLATLLLIALGASVISVLAPGYGAAVPYVPLTAMAYVSYGFLLTVFRAGDFFTRRVRAYGFTAGGAGLGVIVFALVGSHLIGVAGVPIGAGVGCLIPSVVLLVIGERRHHPLPLDYPRLLATLVLGAACWAPGAILGLHTQISVIAKLAGVLAFVVGVAALGIIPRARLREVGALLRSLLPHRRGDASLLTGLPAVPDRERETLLAIVRDHVDPTTVALRLGIDEVTVRRRVVSALRALGGGSGAFPLDERLGYYLTSGDPPADLDAAMRDFRRAGADMVEFRVLESVYGRLRRLPRATFTAAVLGLHQPPDPIGLGALLADGVLTTLAQCNWSMAEATRALGLEEAELDVRMVGELRELAGCPATAPFDHLVARFLLATGPERDSGALWAAGVDPIELHRLELALTGVRDHPPRRRRLAHPSAEAIARPAVASEPVH